MKFINKDRIRYFILLGLTCFIMFFLVGYSIYIRNSVRQKSEKEDVYVYHYAFISDIEDAGEMWNQIYDGAYSYGVQNGVYVEWFGKNLVQRYSKPELMDMAIAAKVDGIIIQGDDSSKLNSLVNDAKKQNIPVVTAWKDCYGSLRDSYVGMSSYNLGQKYGEYFLQKLRKGKTKILVIIDSKEEDSSEKLVYAGMRETVSKNTRGYDVETLIVDSSTPFEPEQSLRTLLLEEELPDVILCLDENTTDTLSQLIVDYNKVGEAKIVGFYNSDRILHSLSRGVIEATLSTDASNIGKECVQVLLECNQNAYVSDYIPVDIDVITGELEKESVTKEVDNEKN